MNVLVRQMTHHDREHDPRHSFPPALSHKRQSVRDETASEELQKSLSEIQDDP